MRILEVSAEAFGPLHGAKLRLAPGLTVVCGNNESGKSSWHAASYAALCGRRRGKGAPSREERRFATLRRPWGGQAWSVSCQLELDDGRRVELRHDLDGLVDCRATELARGRDVSAEIIYDGTPDGSRWLGLTRRSFAATACVDQAELLGVLAAAGELQTELQRAAATAGTDSTASAALEALHGYRRLHVGPDRAGSNRPLRRAQVAAAEAETALAEARRAHAEHLVLLGRREEAVTAAGAAAAERATAQQSVATAELLVDEARSAVAADEAAEAEAAAAHTRAVTASAGGAGSWLRPVGIAVVTAGVLLVALRQPLLGLAGVVAGASLIAGSALPWRRVRSGNAGQLAASAGSVAAAEQRLRLARQRLDQTRGWSVQAESAAAACRGRLEVARDRETEACSSAAQIQGAVEERQRSLPSVTEAEEALAAARAELARVRDLDAILSTTVGFLEQAKERAHLTIAPQLAGTLCRWLPELTAGRYLRALVDPETLEVKVASATGAWRPAGQLSVGTAEQVYLLLRVALAEHLSGEGVSCPLLLDDVTVQADPERTEAILAMCKALAEEGRQIVLFTQESAVCEWAERELRPPQHRVQQLDPVPVG
jgi:recombinational DNA repair ATPase RecF